MLLVHEPRAKIAPDARQAVRSGIEQVVDTFREIRSLKHIFLFLLAYWLYIDGVDTIVRMAVDYGMSIGFQSNDLILALLLTHRLWLAGREDRSQTRHLPGHRRLCRHLGLGSLYASYA